MQDKILLSCNLLAINKDAMYRNQLFNPFYFIMILVLFFTSCSKDVEDSNTLDPEEGTFPTLTTNYVSDITQNSAVSGGKISSDGKSAITLKGICWSTTQNPTIANSNSKNGSGTADFTGNVSGIFPGTTYYVRAYAINKNGTGYGQQVEFTTPAVLITGINYAGGIIFYLDSTGLHGLVSANYDQSIMASWGCPNINLPGASGTAIGTGLQNTLDIIENCETTGIAAEICNGLILNGYSDWFLPSKEELKLMYVNLKTLGIGSFSNSPYWSSSEMSDSFAWAVIFNGGTSQGSGKNNFVSVRSVRAF